MLTGSQSLQVHGDPQLRELEADPGWLREGRPVQMQAQAPYIESNSIFRSVGDTAQGEVADPLYGDAGDYPQDSENNKGGQI